MAAFVVWQQGCGDVMREQSKKEQTLSYFLQPLTQGRVTILKIFEEEALGARLTAVAGG